MGHRTEDVWLKVAAPTLVVTGERDPIVPQEWVQEATSLLRDGRLVVLPGAGPTITNTRPDQLVDMALPFLLGGERGRPAPDATA